MSALPSYTEELFRLVGCSCASPTEGGGDRPQR